MWKRWPAWLRGGVVLGVLGLLVIAGVWIWGYVCFIGGQCYPNNPYAGISAAGFVMLANYPGVLLLGERITMDPIAFVILIAIISVVTYFIAGAIIGWIIGKLIKGKKRNRNNGKKKVSKKTRKKKRREGY